MQLSGALEQDGIKRVLIVTDPGIVRHGLHQQLLQKLQERRIFCAVFDGVHPNPTVEDVEAAARDYDDNGCDAVVALGGGSSLDCGKVVAALWAVQGAPVQSLRGNFKVTAKKKRDVPPVYAIPTTAGTGSETTIVAVVTDTETHEKYTIQDTALLPRRVALDAELTLTLPSQVTAAAGMDALTHAVESYIGRFFGNRATRAKALEATGLIFQNLETAYANGSNLAAREKLLYASFIAGESFGTAAIGYCHAIAHALGGLLDMPHGELNGIILPRLLRWYGPAVTKPLAALADAAGMGVPGAPDAQKAAAFIAALEALRRNLHMPDSLPPLGEAELQTAGKRAMAEGNPLYPVPKLMNQAQCAAFIRTLSTQEGSD